MPAKMNHFDGLEKDIRVAASYFDSLPDEQEYTPADTGHLDGLRYESLRLARVIEAIFEGLQGVAKPCPPPK